MDRSHLILRTNPRLTGNIKLMVGHDMMYMSTIPINETLSDQQYVSNPINPASNYSTDVYSIFNSVPRNILYQIPEIDHNQYAKKNSEQYVQTYNYGCRRLVSKLYDEQFSSFAPLLLGDKIPDAYMLFKIPLSKQQNIKSWTASDYFKEADIVTTFDLKKSKIGTYIQNLINHPLFHNPPITVNYETKTVTYCGISVYKGSIVSMTESILHLFDQELPIKEFDQYITDGFYRNGLVLSNLLNLEFMFDDVDTDFSTSMYYGLYVNYKDIDSYDPIKIEKDYNQYLQNCYCYIRNDDGIQKYRRDIARPLQYDRSLIVYPVRSSGYSSMSLRLDKDLEVGYELRLYLNDKYLETIIIDTLLQLDANDYQYQQWSNVGQLQTYVNPIGSKSEVLHRIGLAIQWVLSAIENYSYKFFVDEDELVFYANNRFFPTLSICSYLLDRNGQTLSDGYITFSSFNLIGYSSSKNKRFKIAKSQLPILQSKLIQLENHQYTTVETISAAVDERLIDENHNLLETDNYRNYCIVTIKDTLPQILFNGNSIQLYSKKQLNFGLLDVSPISDFDYDFHSMEYASGHESEYSHYYSTRSGDLVIGQQYTVFNNSEEIPLELQMSVIIDEKLRTSINVPKGGKITFVAQSTDYTIVSGYGTIINNFYLLDNELNTFVGFNTLSTIIGKIDNKLKINSFKDNSKNEYEVLKENSTSTNVYLSKLIPHVNKWVMNNNDIRNNEYRLNMSSSFGSLSFTPSFNAIESDPSKFTHEWYYLSCYPKGLTRQETYDSSSYFDHAFDVEQYASSNIDYFTDYFTVNSRTIIKKNGSGYSATVLPVKFQRRYSIIHKDQDTLNTYSTFFRGCKMSFTSDDVDINGYKFSCILNLKRTNQNSFSIENPFSIDVVRNDTFKNMVIVITALIDDYKVLDVDGQINSGYLYLYVMNHLQSINDGKLQYGIKFDLPIDPQLKEHYDIQYGSSDNKRKLDFSSIYGTRLGFQTGGRYSDFWNDGGIEASILQFNINQLKVSDFYHLDNNGRYQELIGFNKKQLFFTNGSSYNLESKEILINEQSAGVRGYMDYGIKVRAIKKSQKNSINYTDGGITTIKYVDSPNKLPIDTYTTNALKKNGSLINSNWIILGGGYNHYQKLNSLLAFSNICKLFSNNSPIVQYYTINNNRIIPSKDYFNIQFIQPSTLKLQSGLISKDKDVILKELPNVVLQDTEINASKTPIELYRYSGEFYPKLTEIANFSGMISKANWKTKIQRWMNVNKQWLDRVSTDEAVTAINSLINDSRLQSNVELQDNNILLSGDLIIKNYYYKKINQELPIIPLLYPTNGYSSIEKENKNLLSSVLSKNYYHEANKESLDYNQLQSFFGSIMTTVPQSLTVIPAPPDCIIKNNTIKFSLVDVLYNQIKDKLISEFGTVSEEWIKGYLSQYLIKSYFVSSINIWSKDNDGTIIVPEHNELKLLQQNYNRLLAIDINNQDYNYTLNSSKFVNKKITIHVILSLV